MVSFPSLGKKLAARDRVREKKDLSLAAKLGTLRAGAPSRRAPQKRRNKVDRRPRLTSKKKKQETKKEGSAMRRADREVTDRNQLEEILKACHAVHIGAQDGDGMFVSP